MSRPPLVVATPYGRAGASSRVRVYDWLDHLGLTDAEVHDYRGAAQNRPASLLGNPFGTIGAEARTRRLFATGSLLISREASPLSAGGLEARLLRSAGHGVYDVDDALFHDSGSGLRRVLSKAQTFARSVAAADVVIVGNDYLAERAASSADQVVVIPSCVEPDAYQVKTDYAVGPWPRLLWVGSPSTEAYLLGVGPALLEVHRRTGARLLVVSAGAASLGRLDAMVDRLVWTPTAVSDAAGSADLAIGPLSDTPYARGKCAYKLLQYAACGLPMVASPVGANKAALDLLGGVAASSTSDWVEALSGALAATTAEREELGRRARAGVAEHYSFGRWADDWVTAVQP